MGHANLELWQSSGMSENSISRAAGENFRDHPSIRDHLWDRVVPAQHLHGAIVISHCSGQWWDNNCTMLPCPHAGVPAGVRAVKEWTTKVRLVESASALSGGAAAAAAAASEQVPFAEVALQQLNISDRIRLLRPEGRRSTYREIHVLRLPVPAAPLPASPAPSPVAPLQQSDTPAAASSAAGAQELEAPSLPNTAAILPRAISNSPPSLQSARRALRAWTPQEGIPERALLPSSPTPSLVKVSHAHATTGCPNQAGPALQ